MRDLPCQTYIARSANQCTVIPPSEHEGTSTFRFRIYSHLGKMRAWNRMRGHFKKALGTSITGPRNIACSEESQSEPLSATYSEQMRTRVCSSLHLAEHHAKAQKEDQPDGTIKRPYQMGGLGHGSGTTRNGSWRRAPCRPVYQP